ncbi:lipoate--protein ligase family protein [Ralstonia soli]|uniref:Ligase n=1 Tax=Ralstonia soli TaxID=2953896 RepID=A0ABT1ATN2_9RALS|nr:ligase [Ralstonia soli]MCO5401574.1 ligase [Ralstonia soli]
MLAPAFLSDGIHCADEQEWNRAQLAAPVLRPAVRLWTYAAPGVVLGRAQAALHPGMAGGATPVVVRDAGGGAVLAGPWMLSASIVLPADHPLVGTGTVSSYRWLGVLYAGLLRDLGIPAYAVPPEELQMTPPDRSLKWACFGSLSPWEVVVGQRKIVGLAQVRRRTGVLLTCGTLIAPPDWPLLCAALRANPEDALRLQACTTSCSEQLGVPLMATVLAEGLHHMLVDVLGEQVDASDTRPSRRAPYTAPATRPATAGP